MLRTGWVVVPRMTRASPSPSSTARVVSETCTLSCGNTGAGERNRTADLRLQEACSQALGSLPAPMPYESADLRRLAREPHLESLVAAMSVGHLGIPGGVPEAAGAARAAPPGPGPRPRRELDTASRRRPPAAGPDPVPGAAARASSGLVRVASARREPGEDGVDETGAEVAVQWGAAEQQAV